jgi:tetrahydromethanopterin S-methyltransferase subunit G
VKGIAGSGGREAERSELRGLNAALAQATARLDNIEREYGARLDKLGEGVDPNSLSKFADIAARLDALERKAATPAAAAPEFTDVEARLDRLEKSAAAAPAPAPDLADLKTRLDRMEKRVAAAAADSAAPLSAAARRHSTPIARAQLPAPNETVRAGAPKPLLQDYAVEDVQDGIALVGGRYGQLQVAPGDFIPGAGRVLRIERRGGDWYVLTNNGVIAGGRAPY